MALLEKSVFPLMFQDREALSAHTQTHNFSLLCECLHISDPINLSLPDCASTKSTGHIVGLIDVLSKHGGCKPIFCVIGSCHYLLEGFKLQDLHHWTKNLQVKTRETRKQKSILETSTVRNYQVCVCVC